MNVDWHSHSLAVMTIDAGRASMCSVLEEDGFRMSGHRSVFCLSSLRSSCCGGVVLVACTLTCPPTECRAAGILFVFWPGRGRGGVQVVGAVAAVVLAVFVVVIVSCTHHVALTQVPCG